MYRMSQGTRPQYCCNTPHAESVPLQVGFKPQLGEAFALLLHITPSAGPGGSPPPAGAAPASGLPNMLLYDYPDAAPGPAAARSIAAERRLRRQILSAADSSAGGGAGDDLEGGCGGRAVVGRAVGDVLVYGPLLFTAADAVEVTVWTATADGSAHEFTFPWGAAAEERRWALVQRSDTLVRGAHDAVCVLRVLCAGSRRRSCVRDVGAHGPVWSGGC